MELRIGDRSVDLQWSTIVVAPVPGPAPSPASARAVLERGADVVLVSVSQVAAESSWSEGAVPFCCEAGDLSAARRAIELGAEFVVVPESMGADAEPILFGRVVVATDGATDGAADVTVDGGGDGPGRSGRNTSVPRLRDLRRGSRLCLGERGRLGDTVVGAGDEHVVGNGGGVVDGDAIDLADVAASMLLDADSPVRVVLTDDPRSARRCADLVETLRREQAGVPS